MNRTTLAIALVGVGGGIVGGWLAASLASPLPGTSSTSDVEASAQPVPFQRPAADDSTSMGDLVQRIAGLEIELDLLRGELSNRREEIRMTEAEVVVPPVQEVVEDARALGPNLYPVVEQQVAAVLDAREEAERLEREKRNAERRKNQVERRVESLARRLELNDIQSQEMNRILLDNEIRRGQLWSEIRESGRDDDREYVRASFRTLGEEMNLQLEAILLPEQMEKYQEIGRDDGRRGRDSNRGRRGD